MVATCGFDARGNPRLAAPDFNCRTDDANKLWGFCPSSVIYAHDCGLAGYCIDDYDCVNGCGPHPGNDQITTFTCTKEQHCSTVKSDNFGHSFDYIACGAKAGVETIFARPPPVSATTTSSTFSSTLSSSISSTTSSSTVESTSTRSSSTPTSASSLIATTSPPLSASSPVPLGSATNEPDTSAATNNSTPLGPIIGGVVGGVAMVCLTILAIFLIRHRRSSSSSSNTPLRRSSSLTKHPEHEEQFEVHELSDQRYRFVEASDMNNDPAELPGHEQDKQGKHGSAV